MFDVRLRCGTRLNTSDLEIEGISYVPCGKVNGEDQPLLSFAHLWGNRSPVTLQTYGKKANAWTLSNATGVQLMTGYPTFRKSDDSPDGFVYLTDIDIEKLLLNTHAMIVERIIKVYREACDRTPCIIQTKSGGRRLSVFAPYLDTKREFKDAEDRMLLEIFSVKGLSRLDDRYALLEGSILDIPVIPKSALQEIHGIITEVAVEKKHEFSERTVVESSQIDNLTIEWGEDGKSQYFTASHCQATSHKNSERLTVQFQRYRGGVQGHCFNCGESWWEIEPVKPAKELIERAPPVETRETPSFPYFSKEERTVVRDVLDISPDAGWHGQTPVFSTKYEHLYKLTNKFALNGQPSNVERRRVWSTRFGNCKLCGAVTAKWVDRYLLIAGLYCDGCHKDYHLGSYLELELFRTLENSIVSDYHGFLGDDPEFEDFRLWEPQMLTHLGAGMSTGKSTEIYKAMIALASQGIGKGIIAVPRVSLARFLAHYLRRRDGYRAWGLWHEGVRRADRFIGEYGAIVCLPSLPRAVQSATDDGVDQLHIAIDELDFSYGLLSLSVEQATAVKKCLRDALNTTGLVVSGQTESTLALEAFASELDSENVQGFYNTAKPSEGCVILQKHANIEGKSNAVLAGAIEDIFEFIDAGHNVYAFCSSRRDGDIIAAEFADLDPVLYNAYTKGDKRAEAILKNQKLTDSQLLVATSAAGVGISILDPKARTVIASGLNYGSRDANMIVQMNARERGRRGGTIHYTEYELSLPVKPLENETVSLYHEALKIAKNKRSHLPEAGIKKIARAEALASLADHQIETFISHHLGTVGNMPVYEASVLMPSEDKIAIISERRSALRGAEREKKLASAVNMLKNRNLLTSSEIRVRSNKGEISPDLRLAYEAANGYACAIGWNDKIDRDAEKPFDEVLDDTDVTIAIALAEKNVNVEKLAKQRRGYIAVNFPNWTAYAFQTALANTKSDLVNDGVGIEPTAIHDDRFRGELLQGLLNRLAGTVFDVSSLASAVREILKQNPTNGQTFIGEIHRGALGGSEYRKARFLAHADDDRIVDWASQFIAEWYPARIQKREDHFALTHAANLNLRLASFQRWLIHQSSPPDNMPTDLEASFQPTEIPDPDAELKAIAQFRRESGETIKSIAENLKRNPRTIRKWCQSIKPPSPSQSEVLSIIADGKVWKTADIVGHSRFADRNVRTALKALLDAGTICKIKRGHYQKKVSYGCKNARNK